MEAGTQARQANWLCTRYRLAGRQAGKCVSDIVTTPVLLLPPITEQGDRYLFSPPSLYNIILQQVEASKTKCSVAVAG